MDFRHLCRVQARTGFLLLALLTCCSLHLKVTCEESQEPPNQVVRVDLQLKDNVQRHHTSQYKINTADPYKVVGPSIVLRRGEPLDVSVFLQKPFDKVKDQLRIELAFGSYPQIDKATLIYIPLERKISANSSSPQDEKFSSFLTSVRNEQLDVSIQLPTNMAIGIWKLRISTKKVNSKNLKTFNVPTSLYVIFNAWNPRDQVYMANEEAREEYVQNEAGKIYIGSFSRPTGRQWTYGQFHPSVLPTMMVLLDQTRLDIGGRSDVVKVSRAVSAAMNSHDDSGLLVGNWSGNYGDGLAPWHWTNSAVIFEKYLVSGFRPVKFGQCWVFGGVLTTALRTLGIPARAITNFMSAHDTDSSLTVDKFFSGSGEELKSINGDSIWNFHVWADAWMMRKDLPPGFDGWQAVDSTPQERSNNKYQLGPASLEAIKQGKVDYAYDVGFVYSEVNADLVHWRLDPRGRWRRYQVMTANVGRLMLTKMIGVMDNYSRFSANDAENINNQYKHVEGSKEERETYQLASKVGGLYPMFGS